MPANPAVHARFDSRDGRLKVLDYEIILERQRPAVATFVVEAPLAPQTAGLFSLGYDRLTPLTALVVESNAQVRPDRFEIEANDPLRQFLDAPYSGQALYVKMGGMLKRVCNDLGWGLHLGEVNLPQKVASPVFFGTLRNALDQIWAVYEPGAVRWWVDTMEQKFYLFDPNEGRAAELPAAFVKEETEGGVEMNILPQMRPFVAVRHRGERRVVDQVRFDGKRQSMFLEFAEMIETPPMKK